MSEKESHLSQTRCEMIHQYFTAIMGRDYFAREYGWLGLKKGNIAESVLKFAKTLGATESDIEYLAKHYGFERVRKGFEEGEKVKKAREAIEESHKRYPF